jgi:site-specific DNA-methyltransferase (adenine-specific)
MTLIDDTPGRRIWRGEGWELREGRWEDSPPEVVDVVIADPPYDERTHNGVRRTKGRTIGPNGKRAIGVERKLSFPPINPKDIGPRLVGMARRWVVLFCAIEQLGAYQEACAAGYVRGGWFWKEAPQPQLSGDRPGVPGDGVAILHRESAKRWNGGGSVARWPANPSAIVERHHEAQKPLALMRALVADFSDPGELVWDPYAGSATTGVACLELGRRFLGHEMQAHYAELAAERLAAEDGFTLREARALREHGDYQRAKRAKQGALEL